MFLRATLLITALCLTGRAQQIVWQRTGVETAPFTGSTLGFGIFLNDVDGDGWDDLVLMGTAYFPGIHYSKVTTLSGRFARRPRRRSGLVIRGSLSLLCAAGVQSHQ